MRSVTVIKALLLAMFVLSGPAYAAGGKDKGSEFPVRKMRSIILPIENGDFKVFERKEGSVKFSGWVSGPVPVGRSVSAGKGYERFLALTVKDSGRHEKDCATVVLRVSNRVAVPAGWRSENMNFSVSAWVWSDEPVSTFFEIGSKSFTAVSAYHPGNGKWEYLTAVFPFSGESEKDRFTVTLVSKKGTSRFSSVKPVALIDDRFDGLTDEELRFRERLTYEKTGRIRVAVVGNSTIWGTGAPRNSTISYILQSKLESLYPGRFEVVNYGIGCWSMTNQIVAIKNNFVYKTWCNTTDSRLTPYNIRDTTVSPVKDETKEAGAAHQRNAVTLFALAPDMILLGSLWNDVVYTLFFDTWPANSSFIDGVPLLNMYYMALYNYMDDPTAENYEIALLLHNRAKAEGEAEATPMGEKDVAGNAQFERLKEIARLKDEFLVNEFLRRAGGVAKAALFNLPSKDAGRSAELIDKAPWFLSRGAFLISDTSKASLKGYFHIFDTASAIDEMVLSGNSKKFNAPFLNIKKIFDDGHRGVSAADYVNLEYFHDTIHFTYRGNEWIADRIFMELRERFAAMAG